MNSGKHKTTSKKLIEKFFEGSYSEDIERRFHLWLLDEKDGGEKGKALEEIWEEIPMGDPAGVRGSLQEVRQKLGFPARKINRGGRRLALRVAAVVVPFMVVLGGYFYMGRNTATTPDQSTAYLEVHAGVTVTLPDLTTVEITKGTLTYPAEFTGAERKVKLEGDAFFSVEADAAHPFIVENDILGVRVTGTEFIVTSCEDNVCSTVTLLSGSVDVLIPEREPVALTQWNELTYNSHSGELTVTALPEGYRRDIPEARSLEFNDMTLGEILSAIAVSRGYTLRIREGAIDGRKYTVKFINGETPAQMLDILDILTDGISYRIENNNIYIE